MGLLLMVPIRRLWNVKQAFDAELAQTDLTNQEAVNNLRVKYLGKKGAVTDLMKQMGTLSAEERPAYGKLVNELKVAVSEAIDKAIETANQAARERKGRSASRGNEGASQCAPGFRTCGAARHAFGRPGAAGFTVARGGRALGRKHRPRQCVEPL